MFYFYYTKKGKNTKKLSSLYAWLNLSGFCIALYHSEFRPVFNYKKTARITRKIFSQTYARLTTHAAAMTIFFFFQIENFNLFILVSFVTFVCVCFFSCWILLSFSFFVLGEFNHCYYSRLESEYFMFSKFWIFLFFKHSVYQLIGSLSFPVCNIMMAQLIAT